MAHAVKGLPSLRTLLLISSLAQAVAAEPAAPALAEARQLFAEAMALEGTGDYAAASAKLESALAIKETPGLRYHLAHCKEQLGALVAAAADYERAEELIRAGASAPDVEPLLPLAARRIDTHVAKLEIVVPPAAGVTAELDGRPLPPSAIGSAVRIDPGSHRLVVRSPGHADFKADLTFADGEHRTIRVLFDSPGAPVTAKAPPVAPAPRPSERTEAAPLGAREVVLMSEAALTLTGLGLGIGFSVVRGNASSRVESAQARVDAQSSGSNDGCATTPAPAACADLDRALDDHARASTIATAGFVGAGVAAGALALTWALWPASPRPASFAIQPRAAGAELVAGGVF